MGGYNLDHMEM